MKNCEACGIPLSEDDIYFAKGKCYCEDCAMSKSTRLRKCDVAAVHSAVSTRKAQGLTGTDGLSDLQKELYDFTKETQGATMEQYVDKFGMSAEEIDKQLTVLRHCELCKGQQREDGVYFVLWDA